MKRNTRSLRRIASGVASIVLAGTVSSMPAVAYDQDAPIDCSTTAPTSGDANTFNPEPQSQPVFGIGVPNDDPNQRKLHIPTVHGSIYVEVYQPLGADGSPLEQVPTILDMTPYGLTHETNDQAEDLGDLFDPPFDEYAECFVRRGYAVAVGHVLGTGNSGGCVDFWGPKDVGSTIEVIRYLTEDTEWSNGALGMIGTSYSGGVALAVAATNHPVVQDHLRAVVAIDAPTDVYAFLTGMDGVPYPGGGTINRSVYFGFWAAGSTDPSITDGGRDPSCWPASFGEVPGAETSGNYTSFDSERETRRGASSVTAAILLMQGLQDLQNIPLNPVGFFDRLPSSTPRRLLLGQFGHEYPRRGDVWAMFLVWFDQHLMGLDAGVDEWPNVQLQDNTGTWRAEQTWPQIAGKEGQLALDADNTLGATKPEGSTGPFPEPVQMRGEGTSPLTFRTDLLDKRLQISGQPVLDLWVELTQPDAHIVADLSAFDENGNKLVSTWGFRSAQHLDPLSDGYFHQQEPRMPDITTPVQIAVRLQPFEMVVPAGGYLQLEIGTLRTNDFVTGPGPSGISSSYGEITVLHDCATETASTLRFLMPKPMSDVLSVAAPDHSAFLGSREAGPNDVDGGLATEKVCGKKAIDPLVVVEGVE